MSVIATEGADPSPDRLLADKISYHDFSTMLLSFAERAPKKMQGLEELRYNEIPKVLAQRKEDGEAFLEKTEVQSLIEWKLYVCIISLRTSFRPAGTGSISTLQKIRHLPTQTCHPRRF